MMCDCRLKDLSGGQLFYGWVCTSISLIIAFFIVVTLCRIGHYGFMCLVWFAPRIMGL